MTTTRKPRTRATTPEPDDGPLTEAEAAYRLRADEPDHKVRARARRAAHGEAIRSSRTDEPFPAVRERTAAGLVRTEVVGRLMPGTVRGQVDVRKIDR
ncbi:hypothetical protein [Isoptericola sp. NPDC019482]|uniref:hypothetical protein n=1 Tax=Isoptericola sp. NPDC019482 TaxID=3154688 RepID=UPI00348DCD2F